MGFTNIFSERLRLLYEEKKIDLSSSRWSGNVARELVDGNIMGCAFSDDEDGKTLRKKKIINVSHTLREHINDEEKTAADISGKWLDIYRKYFGCSVSYLFGEIDGFNYITTKIQDETGLTTAAVKTLREYRLTGSGLFGEKDNTIGEIVSFLLDPKHCDRNAGGLLHLIAAYIHSNDFSVSGLDESMEYIHTDGKNGSGFELKTADVVRAAIPNMILQRLEEYRQEKARSRKK